MYIDKMTEIAYKAMGDRKTQLEREQGFIFYHCERVAKLSLNLRQKIIINDNSMDDIIYVGALFHDVAKGIEPHNEVGACLVKDLLKEQCTAEELVQISEIVKKHDMKKAVEEFPSHIKIVQDADKLDHMGSIQVWLRFLVGAHSEESISDSVDFWQGKYFNDYVKSTREKLNFDLTKSIFDEKVQFLNGFIERLKVEMNGGLQ